MIAVATKTTKPKKVSTLADIELKISTAIITSYLRLGELLHEAKTSRIYKPLTSKCGYGPTLSGNSAAIGHTNTSTFTS